MMARLVTEFIGTFFLVLTIGLSANPIAIGMVLTALIYMGGHISGAHYNPAVSFGMFIRGILSLKDMVYYMLTQFLAGFIAALVVLMITGIAIAPAPAPGTGFLTATLIEVLFTFGLMLVILNVATARKNQPNSYYGAAIGFYILGAAAAGGPISGAAFNPAVAVGPAVVSLINSSYPLENLPVYLIGPFLGALIAAFVFKVTNPDEFKDISLTYHEN